MKVIEYIKQNGLDSLNKDFGIIIKKYDEDGLIVLNYDQIESPKNEITNECRSLILDYEFNIVSRSFDRFFNYGENFATFDPKTAVAFEKVDGSLIKIYNYKGWWYVSTRGTAFAESGVNGWDISFKDMVYKALVIEADGFGRDTAFQTLCNSWLNPSSTYICEVTGVENRVVTRYSGYTLWLLAERDNQSGVYQQTKLDEDDCFGFKQPKQFKFDTIDACLETAKHLPDLQEGYVMYETGIPVCKVKSPAYVAIHAIKGEGLTPKRIAELVVINEQEEYLTYFEEDRVHFEPYVTQLKSSLLRAECVYETAKYLPNQKDFALQVKDYPFAFILFAARKLGEDDIYKVFNSFDKNAKVKFLLGLMGSEE
jgi:RNA ligase